MKSKYCLLCLWLVIGACTLREQGPNHDHQPVYRDEPYLQDFAIKFYAVKENGTIWKCYTDRNQVIQILSSAGLFRPDNGRLQYPGTLEPDHTYRPMADKRVRDMAVFRDQFIYLDEKAIFSNAWAGSLYSPHLLKKASLLCPGKDFTFLISDGSLLAYQSRTGTIWQDKVAGQKILDIRFDDQAELFYILAEKAVFVYAPHQNELKRLYKGGPFTCFDLTARDQQIILGTDEGYLRIDKNGNPAGSLQTSLPCTELTVVKEIDGHLWFGSTKGSFMLRDDGKFNYYYGERWLPGVNVKHISPGPDHSVLILTDAGLGQICFKPITLEEKAMFYEKQVRQRQIRYGINSNVTQLVNHDLSTAENRVADSDNLWTAMYLGSQLFRYLATGSDEAKQNCYEAFEAMERMHTINNIRGLFGRSFERRGYQAFRREYRDYVNDFWYDGYQGLISWQHADDPEWDWRGSASSDQTVGQMFAMTLIAEYIDDDGWQQRAIRIIDDLMSYLVDNDLYLVDYNGKPSLWGRWNPSYVNRFDTMVGDRKICSSNIIAFLQSAYHFTGKEKYKLKAMGLLEQDGYLENLMRPFSEIGPAPDSADAWSRMLSAEWNHSDDEMYFLAYWCLYPYAFNDTLKTKYREAIRDHWQAERPEKDALWNFCYAMTGTGQFDLDESIWYLKEFPLDMIQYEIHNSHRKDITRVASNFRGETTARVLPPDERPELKHNRNVFTLDAGDRHSLLSAGDTFLLPYWMGRFLGVISASGTGPNTENPH